MGFPGAGQRGRFIGRDTVLCMSLAGRPGQFGSRFHNHLFGALAHIGGGLLVVADLAEQRPERVLALPFEDVVDRDLDFDEMLPAAKLVEVKSPVRNALRQHRGARCRSPGRTVADNGHRRTAAARSAAGHWLARIEIAAGRTDRPQPGRLGTFYLPWRTA